MYDFIKSPIKIGDIKLKNRIIFAPTTMGLKFDDYKKRIEGIAKGGVSLIIIGDVPVDDKIKALSLFSDEGFERYKQLCSIAHENDCKIAAQLHVSDTDFSVIMPYMNDIKSGKITREDLRPIINDATSRLITNMTIDEINTTVQNFGKAAKLAVKAGFDMIQVHGDRMCGSFSSNVFNKRTDIYGQTPENRARFAVECVKAVREAVPNTPIDYKLAVRQESPHYGNAGVVIDELTVFVPLFEKAGVDSFHVTLANHSKLEDTIPMKKHDYFGAEGCFLKYCDEVKKYTNKPICGVGGLTTPEFIENQLKDERIQLAAMSRQLLADANWINKVISDNTDKIRHCIRCNKKCLYALQQHREFGCIFDN